jgi:hypothetical protein
MDDDWERDFFSEEELKELYFSSENIVANQENGITIHMGFNNEFCISLCKRWYSAINEGDLLSVVSLHAFFQSFIDHVEEHLEEEGIDWKTETEL